MKVILPKELPALAKQWGIRTVAVFGSVARGESNSASDLDLLVDFSPGRTPSLLGHARLQNELSRVFGREADVSTKNSILRASNKTRGQSILLGAVEIFHDP